MAKKQSPNAKVDFPADGPAYVSWAGNKEQQAQNLKVYTKAINKARKILGGGAELRGGGRAVMKKGGKV